MWPPAAAANEKFVRKTAFGSESRNNLCIVATMDLPEEIIGLLRDEAYLRLCREAVEVALEGAAKEKDAVASTRPPFGMLASKKARETFEHSMRTVLTTEAALQNRREKIKVLESALQAKLRPALHHQLESIAPDYRHRPVVLAAVAAWEALIESYGEHLQAFARELRQTVGVISAPTAGSPEGMEERMSTLAALQLAAGGVDQAAGRLDAAASRVAASANALYSTIDLAGPPFTGQGKWAERVTELADPGLLAEVGQTEGAVRELLTANLAALRDRATAARAQIDAEAGHYLLTYWKQLREYALANYVEEKDVDEVIAIMTERYITAELQRHRQRLTTADDPYMGER
jgi:hypothetical protein